MARAWRSKWLTQVQGITRSEQARVFEPFFTTKGMEGGTGLGLAICKEIVLNHQGEIRIESEEGCGARVIVSLPVAGSPTDRLEPSLSPRKEEVHGNGIA